jgi:hypothetical protein
MAWGDMGRCEEVRVADRRSTPLIVGTEKDNEGRPGARFHREAERWLERVRQKWYRLCEQDMRKETNFRDQVGP